MNVVSRLLGRKSDPAPEVRSIENPQVPISNSNILQFLGLGGVTSAAEPVTIDSALGVPAIWAAVNFLSGTIAGLPLHVYQRRGDGRQRVSGGVAPILHNAVNDGMSSFEWRKYIFDQVLTGGRSVSFIERNGAGRVSNIWPLEGSRLVVRWAVSGADRRKLYEYQDGGRKVIYEANEVIDIPFMLKADMLQHRSPIFTNADVVGRAQAITKYGGRFFQNGGVPPFVVTGPLRSPAGLARASEDLAEAVIKATKEARQALVLPEGHDIKPIGSDAESSQLIETHRFVVEEIARIYSIPPTFLQDLTHGTFSNTEQQDLHFVKHTVKRWVEQFEQELNLKLFGRNARQFVEFSLDGLLRGDFKTRMEGYATAINTGQLMPNEARRLENRQDGDGGDRLYLQGAMIPAAKAGEEPAGSFDDET